jgi:hypothetical protein
MPKFNDPIACCIGHVGLPPHGVVGAHPGRPRGIETVPYTS